MEKRGSVESAFDGLVAGFRLAPLPLAHSGKSKLFQNFSALHRTSDYRQASWRVAGQV